MFFRNVGSRLLIGRGVNSRMNRVLKLINIQPRKKFNVFFGNFFICSEELPANSFSEPDKPNSHHPILLPLDVLHTSTLGFSWLFISMKFSWPIIVTYARIFIINFSFELSIQNFLEPVKDL